VWRKGHQHRWCLIINFSEKPINFIAWETSENPSKSEYTSLAFNWWSVSISFPCPDHLLL
jgi:hypothetical protein